VPADVKDNLPMFDLLWRTCFRWGLRPHHLTGDSIYGSLQNIKAVEDAGIRAFVPVRDWTHNAPVSFSKKDFRYDEGQNLYVCPEGEELRHIGNSYTERAAKYRADAAICNSCALKAKWTSANSGRLLRRSFDERYAERVRAYHETEACKKAMRKRQVWIEPLFGEAKQWHGMGRMRLRTLERANCEVLITASGQNIKRLLEFGGRGPRRPAQVAALRPPNKTAAPPRSPEARRTPTVTCSVPSRFSTRCGFLRSSSAPLRSAAVLPILPAGLFVLEPLFKRRLMGHLIAIESLSVGHGGTF
jgi:hypothetical protein